MATAVAVVGVLVTFTVALWFLMTMLTRSMGQLFEQISTATSTALEKTTHAASEVVVKTAFPIADQPTTQPANEEEAIPTLQSQQEWFNTPADDFLDPATGNFGDDLELANLSDRIVAIKPGEGIPGIGTPDLSAETDG